MSLPKNLIQCCTSHLIIVSNVAQWIRFSVEIVNVPIIQKCKMYKCKNVIFCATQYFPPFILKIKCMITTTTGVTIVIKYPYVMARIVRKINIRQHQDTQCIPGITFNTAMHIIIVWLRKPNLTRRCSPISLAYAYAGTAQCLVLTVPLLAAVEKRGQIPEVAWAPSSVFPGIGNNKSNIFKAGWLKGGELGGSDKGKSEESEENEEGPLIYL